MNTEGKEYVVQNARPLCATSSDIGRSAMPPSNPTRMQRRGTSQDLENVLHIAPTRFDEPLRRVVGVLVALVVMCLVMAAVVWWRLLA